MALHSDSFEFKCERSGCRQVRGGVRFRQRGNLKTHWENAHGPDNKYTCPHVWLNSDGTREDCPARFKSRNALLSHRSLAHGYKKGDDDAKIKENPTPEGFVSEEDASQRRGRGRRPVSQADGAFIAFPESSRDDDEAEVNFVLDTLADTEGLKRILDAQGVPFPTLPFKWPQGSSGGKVKSSRSSRKSTPRSSPESTATSTLSPSPDSGHYHQIAATLAATQAVYAQPLPYPLTANVPTLPTASRLPALAPTTELGQQDAIHNAAPPAWSPTLFQPFASSSALPQPQPAPALGMATTGGSMVAPQFANQAYDPTDALLASLGLPLPPLQASYGTQTNAQQTGALMGPMPPAPPSHGELGFGAFSLGPVAASRSSPSFNDLPVGTPMPLHAYGAEGVVLSRAGGYLSVVATAPPAALPAVTEPRPSQAPLDLSNFFHWVVSLGPPAP